MNDSSKSNADRLRHDIDHGKTGDKVPFEDPAAAPLGTDDEAAGTPITTGQAEEARRAETGRNTEGSATRPVSSNVEDRQRRTLPMRWVTLVIVLVVVGVLIVALVS